MALNERSRAAFYEGLHAIMDDEEAIGDVVSNFPARDVEEPATKEFVRAEVADVRTELATLRGDMGTGFAAVRADMAQVEKRLMVYVHDEIQGSQRWTLGLMITMFGLLAILIRIS
ncbi:MAG: hypothetical protein ACR2JF_18765 [Iamia sp.]